MAALTLAPAAAGDAGWFAAVLLGVPVLLVLGIGAAFLPPALLQLAAAATAMASGA